MRDTAVRKVFTAERAGNRPRHVAGGKISNEQLLQAIGQLQALVVAAAEAEMETQRSEPKAEPMAPAAEPCAPEKPAVDHDFLQVRKQISEMAQTIDRTKLEIAAIKHPMADSDPVINASSQLDAIVAATESATQTILDATEQVEEVLKRMVALDPQNAELIGLSEEAGGHLIRVMEACGFQDITGQRITKVVNTLRFIEDRVGAVINIWGEDSFQNIPVETAQLEAEDDDVLMNGPQLEGQGISQADIDALFD